MFNGTFKNLDHHQIAALPSCFIPKDKSNEQIRLKGELAKPLQELQDTARKIAEASEMRAELLARHRSIFCQTLVVEEGVSKRLRAKNEEIQQIGKLNWALEERVRLICLGCQVWRGKFVVPRAPKQVYARKKLARSIYDPDITSTTVSMTDPFKEAAKDTDEYHCELFHGTPYDDTRLSDFSGNPLTAKSLSSHQGPEGSRKSSNKRDPDPQNGHHNGFVSTP